MNPRRVCAVISGLLIVASACSTEGTAEIDASSRGDVAIGQPSQDSGTAATVDPAPLPSSPATTMPPTTTIALYTTTTTTSQEEVVVQGGPGVNHEVFMAALAPLIEAENAMHAFEAEWDAGMTYSETFRGWREVKAIVAESFDEFAFPEDASTEQLLASMAYVKAVEGAHLEWQNVTDFIVTYITNYTPQVFILDAYSQAEFRLRDAIAALDVIEAQGA